MPSIKSLFALFAATLLVTSLYGCTPEVGTDAWCDYMKEKPKGDWSPNEAGDFAEHCLL